MVSPLYPRVISVHRANHQAGAGRAGYGGLQQDAQTLIASGIPASIQASGNARANPAGLPADTVPATWKVFIPRDTVADGVIQDRDLVTDDLGRVFQVSSDYVNRLGWRLTCDRLE